MLDLLDLLDIVTAHVGMEPWQGMPDGAALRGGRSLGSRTYHGIGVNRSYGDGNHREDRGQGQHHTWLQDLKTTHGHIGDIGA